MSEDDAVALFDRLAAEYDGWYQTPLGALADALEQEVVFVLVEEMAGRMALSAIVSPGKMDMLLVASTRRERKRVAAFVFATTPLSKTRPSLLYLDFLAFFASLTVLALVFFGGRQPQPLFLSAIFITSLLCLCIEFRRYGHAPGKQTLEIVIKYLGNCLKTIVKKIFTPFLLSPKSALEQFVAHFLVPFHIS